MRSWVHIITLSLAIVVIHFLCIGVIEKGKNQMIAYADRIEQAILAGEDSAPLLAEAESYWDENQNIWEILIRHSEVEEINIALSRLKALASAHEFEEALSELSELRFALEHIAQSQHVTLVNIL